MADLHRSSKDDRRVRFDAHRERLLADRASIDAAIDYLEHTMDCVHPVIDSRPACAAFAYDART